MGDLPADVAVGVRQTLFYRNRRMGRHGGADRMPGAAFEPLPIGVLPFVYPAVMPLNSS
jgi:hypothetical protein